MWALLGEGQTQAHVWECWGGSVSCFQPYQRRQGFLPLKPRAWDSLGLRTTRGADGRRCLGRGCNGRLL